MARYYRFNLLKILFFLLIVILSGGCSKRATKDQRNVVGIQDEVKENRLSDFILGEGDTIDISVYRKRTSEYIAGVGDTIEIEVYRKKTSEDILGVGDVVDIAVYRKKSSEFTLGVGDTLSINVYRHSEIDRTTKIDLFGKISLPLIGDIKANGKTTTELRDEIQQKLDKYIYDPQVTIDVTPLQNLKIDDFSGSFKISAQKEGRISFPMLGEIETVGKSVNELKEELQEKLSAYLYEPQVSINVTPLQNLKIDDFSGSFKISAQKEGRISFPMLGEIEVAGKSVVELREDLEAKLSVYLYEPQVSIDISAIQDIRIEDLSISTQIASNGNIMYPLLGEIHVDGKSVTEFRNELEHKLAQYLVNPQVTISVLSVESQKVYILGEVRTPNVIFLDKKILVWEALAKAGGFTDDANKKKVLLIRKENHQVRITALDLNYEKMLESGNLFLRNGDILYVKPSLIANIEAFMGRLDNILAPILSIERGIILSPDVVDVLQGEKSQATTIVY